MQAFNSSTFSCQTVNFLTNGISLTFLSSQSKNEKSYQQCSRHYESNLFDFVHGNFTASLPLIYSLHLTLLGSCYCKKQIEVSFLCVCPLIEDKSRHTTFSVRGLWFHSHFDNVMTQFISVTGRTHKNLTSIC